MGAPDDALRAAMQATSEADAAQAAAAQRDRDERASRTGRFRARMDEIRVELIAAGERTIELLLAAPGRGGLQSTVVHKRAFGRGVSFDGWAFDDGYGREDRLLLPSREIIRFHPTDLRRPHARSTLAEWVDVHLRYVSVESGGADGDSIDHWQWSTESGRCYGDPALEEGYWRKLEGTRTRLLGDFAKLLKRAGVRL